MILGRDSLAEVGADAVTEVDVRIEGLLRTSSFGLVPKLDFFFLSVVTLFKTFNPLVPCGNLGLEGFGAAPLFFLFWLSRNQILSSLNSLI